MCSEQYNEHVTSQVNRDARMQAQLEQKNQEKALPLKE